MLYGADFLRFCHEVRALSPKTASAYADTLEDFERTVKIGDPRTVTTRDVDHYLTRKFHAGNAASTRRTRLSGLKAFFRFLYTRGYIDDDPVAVVQPPRNRRGTIPTFTEGEIERMLRAEFPAVVKGARENDFSFARRRRILDFKFIRDTAMLALAYSNALRAEELGRIRNEHYWIDGNSLPALVICGKSADEPSRMRVDRFVGGLIDLWLAARLRAGIASEWIFCGVAGKGPHGGLTARHVMNVLRQRAALVGMTPEKRQISPHVLRYSRATHMYAATKDLIAVQVHLRHASVTTTQNYIRLGSLSAQAKVATNSLPWNRRGLSGLI